ncbi:unnamed protein product [Vitrella brassicaformis CCMP3155]|uniref:Uncharacterized protein n=1 Tax=Vitrella brassicaformis (strain CCMP3155) TaxID=1169540 RepID=A0A0G4G9M7_VITBC|nr:unnamed protein product [Vitrella brassicaformis CCMP3155]|eukprot:CEM25406.1 unnamed protein product [Vitrella brassicaformis CCMP3155]
MQAGESASAIGGGGGSSAADQTCSDADGHNQQVASESVERENQGERDGHGEGDSAAAAADGGGGEATAQADPNAEVSSEWLREGPPEEPGQCGQAMRREPMTIQQFHKCVLESLFTQTRHRIQWRVKQGDGRLVREMEGIDRSGQLDVQVGCPSVDDLLSLRREFSLPVPSSVTADLMEAAVKDLQTLVDVVVCKTFIREKIAGRNPPRQTQQRGREKGQNEKVPHSPQMYFIAHKASGRFSALARLLELCSTHRPHRDEPLHKKRKTQNTA